VHAPVNFAAAFDITSGSAFWVFLYGLFYWISRLSLDSLSSAVLYIGYLLLMTVLVFLVTGKLAFPKGLTLLTRSCTGTVGFLATYWAVRKLYTAIRVD
jgi:transmembrane 9 superfamily protein 2/4